MARRWFGAVAVVLAAAAAAAQGPQLPAGFTLTPVLDNATVTAVRLTLAPGAREQPHMHSYPMLVVLLTRSDLEMHIGQARTKGPRASGDIEFVGAGVSHYAVNAGTTPLEALVLALNPERVRGGNAPPPQPVPGITRKSLLDNAEVNVTRLELEPDAREAVHTHPYDLLVVPTSAARLDVQIGTKKEVRGFAKGEPIFVPRSVPHAVANVGTSAFGVLGVAIK